MPKARSIAVFQSLRPFSEVTLTLLIDASNDMEKVKIAKNAFILVATLEMSVTRLMSSQTIKLNIKKLIVDTKIGFAKFIPLTETMINIAAVDKVEAIRPIMPSFSSISIMMKPIMLP
jgi:hypothetical protein